VYVETTAVDVRRQVGAAVVCVGSRLSISLWLRRFVGEVGRAVSVRWGSERTDRPLIDVGGGDVSVVD